MKQKYICRICTKSGDEPCKIIITHRINVPNIDLIDKKQKSKCVCDEDFEADFKREI